MENIIIEINPAAQETIKRMRDRCAQIAAEYGPNHEYAVQADRDLRAALTMLLSWPGKTRVTSDGELSLSCLNEATGFVFGINFHEKHGIVGTWSVNS